MLRLACRIMFLENLPLPWTTSRAILTFQFLLTESNLLNGLPILSWRQPSGLEFFVEDTLQSWLSTSVPLPAHLLFPISRHFLSFQPRESFAMCVITNTISIPYGMCSLGDIFMSISLSKWLFLDPTLPPVTALQRLHVLGIVRPKT